MTAGMARRLARLENAPRASRVIVVKDYGDTDVKAEIVRQIGGPALSTDLVVVIRKSEALRAEGALQ